MICHLGPLQVSIAHPTKRALTQTGKEAGGWRTVVGLILWKEASDSDDNAASAQKDVTGEILERALFEVPTRPYGSQSEFSHSTTGAAAVSPRHLDLGCYLREAWNTDGLQIVSRGDH
jgi:hypothetical protein